MSRYFVPATHQAPYKAVLLAAVALVATGLEGCSQASDQNFQSLGRRNSRVVFQPGVTKTVFENGVLEFTVDPPLDDSERVVCHVAEAAGEPCMMDDSVGRIVYQSAGPAPTVVRVEIRVGDEAAGRVWEHVIERIEPSVVVFAATPAGITAAIAASRAGQPVVLLEPTRWIGGAMTGGLSKTDIGARGHEVVGGIADEFFIRVRDAERMRGACIEPCNSFRYDFEPKVAEEVFEAMLEEAGVAVERGARLLSVNKADATILSIQTSRGELAGKVFIDASYEGDLMALAGIEYRVGREPQKLAEPPSDRALLAEQEDHGGMLPYRLPRGTAIDPFVVPGDSSSGTLPFIEPRPAVLPQAGEGDSRVMAYNYRLCVTDDPSNRIPFTAPEGYDAAQYEAHGRLAMALRRGGLDLAEHMFVVQPTAYSSARAYYKYDLNGASTFSTDMAAPQMNQAYVEASEQEREQIRAAYRRYIEGLLYTWQTDPRFGSLNEKVARFGYCKDEFMDRGGWPHQLYVRAARRMVGEYVMNENDVMQNGRRPPIQDPVGFGYYDLDMHSHRYFAAPVTWPDGTRREALVLEGFLIVRLPDDAPYPISYRSLIPRAEDATNFLNPVTLSATHVAMSSIRMEPVFMVLGQAAGTAAAIAAETGTRVQDISYAALRSWLLHGGQILQVKGGR